MHTYSRSPLWCFWPFVNKSVFVHQKSNSERSNRSQSLIVCRSEVDVSQIRGVSLVKYKQNRRNHENNKQTNTAKLDRPNAQWACLYKASERSEGQMILWWSVWSSDAHLDICSAFCMHVDVCECRRALSPFLFSPPQCCPHSWVFGTWQTSLACMRSSDHRVCIVARTGSFQTSATVVCSKENKEEQKS